MEMWDTYRNEYRRNETIIRDINFCLRLATDVFHALRDYSTDDFIFVSEEFRDLVTLWLQECVIRAATTLFTTRRYTENFSQLGAELGKISNAVTVHMRRDMSTMTSCKDKAFLAKCKSDFSKLSEAEAKLFDSKSKQLWVFLQAAATAIVYIRDEVTVAVPLLKTQLEFDAEFFTEEMVGLLNDPKKRPNLPACDAETRDTLYQEYVMMKIGYSMVGGSNVKARMMAIASGLVERKIYATGSGTAPDANRLEIMFAYISGRVPVRRPQRTASQAVDEEAAVIANELMADEGFLTAGADLADRVVEREDIVNIERNVNEQGVETVLRKNDGTVVAYFDANEESAMLIARNASAGYYDYGFNDESADDMAALDEAVQFFTLQQRDEYLQSLGPEFIPKRVNTMQRNDSSGTAQRSLSNGSSSSYTSFKRTISQGSDRPVETISATMLVVSDEDGNVNADIFDGVDDSGNPIKVPKEFFSRTLLECYDNSGTEEKESQEPNTKRRKVFQLSYVAQVYVPPSAIAPGLGCDSSALPDEDSPKRSQSSSSSASSFPPEPPFLLNRQYDTQSNEHLLLNVPFTYTPQFRIQSTTVSNEYQFSNADSDGKLARINSLRSIEIPLDSVGIDVGISIDVFEMVGSEGGMNVEDKVFDTIAEGTENLVDNNYFLNMNYDETDIEETMAISNE